MPTICAHRLRMNNLIARARRHLVDKQSKHRQIAQDFLWVSLFVLLGKLAGAAKEMAIASRYGVSEKIDAYAFAMNLVTWPIALWITILTFALVPLLIQIENKEASEWEKFRSEFFGLTVVVGSAGGLLAAWILPMLLLGWLAMPTNLSVHVTSMAKGLIFIIPLGIVCGLFSTFLLAKKQHKNTLLEAIPSLVLILFLIFSADLTSKPLVLGTVVGFGVYFMGLLISVHRHDKLPCPIFGFTSPAWAVFWNGLGALLVGQILLSFIGIIDQIFAARLNPGSLSILNYSNRLLTLILGLGATALSRATLPVFSGMVAHEKEDIDQIITRWVKIAFYFALVLTVICWLFANVGVTLIFERGAFNARDTESVTKIFRVSLLQAPFFISCQVLLSALSAFRMYRAMAMNCVLILASKYISLSFLVGNFGLNGVVISNVAVYMLSMIILLAFVKYRNFGFSEK